VLTLLGIGRWLRDFNRHDLHALLVAPANRVRG